MDKDRRVGVVDRRIYENTGSLFKGLLNSLRFMIETILIVCSFIYLGFYVGIPVTYLVWMFEKKLWTMNDWERTVGRRKTDWDNYYA